MMYLEVKDLDSLKKKFLNSDLQKNIAKLLMPKNVPSKKLELILMILKDFKLWF